MRTCVFRIRGPSGIDSTVPSSPFERFVFRHFFDGLALCGALAEWGLLCWLLLPLGFTPPAALHVAVPLALAVMNRLAARPLEHEPPAGPLAARAGHVLLACAFGALVGAGALAVAGGAWAALAFFGALRAEAGVVAASAAGALVEPGFRALGTVVLAASSAAVGWGYARGYRRLAVTEIALPLVDLAPALAGLRLVHLSDFHLGPLADRAAVRAALDRVVALDPDVVCVTGDIVDSPAARLDSWIPELARLTARHGVYTILGNHDRHVGADRVAEALRRFTGWRVLRDEVAVVEVGGARLHLLGLEDRPDGKLTDALPGLVARVPAGEPAVLLAHRPTVFAEAAAMGVPLTLAGHTHGGQVAVPGVPRINVARIMGARFDAGAFGRDGARLHVSRGLGTSGQRVRVGVPCEITVMRLAARAA